MWFISDSPLLVAPSKMWMSFSVAVIMQLYTNFEIAKAHTNNQVYKEIKAEGREEFTTE